MVGRVLNVYQLFAICTGLPRVFCHTSRAFFRGTTWHIVHFPYGADAIPRTMTTQLRCSPLSLSLALTLCQLLTHPASLSRSFCCHSNCNISLCFRHFVVCRRLYCWLIQLFNVYVAVCVCECFSACWSVCECECKCN